MTANGARRAVIAIVLAMVAGACGESGGERMGYDTAAQRRGVQDGMSATITRSGDTIDAWRIRPDGVGPIAIGMPVDAAESATSLLGPIAVDVVREGHPCWYLALAHPHRTLSGGRPQQPTRVMISNDTVVRVEVYDTAIVTLEGARVGDTQERIRQLYGDRVRVEPHKYVDGSYLIVPSADTTLRYVFETDGRVVTRYRAGRLPEVEWVEGCS